MGSVSKERVAPPDEKLALRRASSVPRTRVTAFKTPSSLRPSFRIQLPSIDFLHIPRSFGNSQCSSVSRSQASRVPLSANILHESPSVNEYATFPSRIAPLSTPPDEKSSGYCELSATKSSTSISALPALHSQNQLEMSSGATAPKTSDEPLGLNLVATTSIMSENAGGDSNVATTSDSGGIISSDYRDIRSCLEQAIDLAVSDLAKAPKYGNTIKVVAQTMPSPISRQVGQSGEKVVNLTSAFSAFIGILQAKIDTAATYITITHAVPANFALTSLPSSPPTTPSGSVMQEDYFTPRVFSSAVPVANRHDTFTRRGVKSPAAWSPGLAVPPATSDFALLERYIPPATILEYDDLFLPTGPSALVDRLMELSTDRGTLLFIYPTKAGAQTFVSKYLNPVLEPVLRSVTTGHCLTADIGVNIGTMEAVEHLATFDGLKRNVSILLKGLNRGTDSTNLSHYTITHTNKAVVHIHRKVWAQWYIKQETPKIRHVTTEYLSKARLLTGDENVSYGMLTREILEGVEHRSYAGGEAPGEDSAIEVGIFVIQRSA